MNENWNSQFEQETGPRGRKVFILVVLLGMILVAGIVGWALLRGEPGTAARTGGDDNNTAFIAIYPAILGGTLANLAAANKRRREGAPPADYTVPTLVVGLVILLIIGIALLVGFGVIG